MLLFEHMPKKTFIRESTAFFLSKIKRMQTKFLFANRRSKSKIRAAISTHQQCYADGNKCGLCWTCIVSPPIRIMRSHVRIHLHLVWTLAAALWPFQASMWWTDRLEIGVPGCTVLSWCAWFIALANLAKILKLFCGIKPNMLQANTSASHRK